MKRAFPVLALLLGLGCSISFAQGKHRTDPFQRYLADVEANRPEPALVRFAQECGVDVRKVKPRYAVGAGSSFALVRNLDKGLLSLDTDFYSTAEVWPFEDRVLVELWANSEDVGSEVRYYKCFQDNKLTQAEVISWNVPAEQSPDVNSWGYSRRWERGPDGRLRRTTADFVDGMERLIPKPKLNTDDEKSLHWTPPMGTLSDLNLPHSMLR